MKRSILIIIAVVLAAAAAIFFYTKDEVTFTKESSMYKAIPLSTPIFVEINSMKSLSLDAPVFGELAEIGELQMFLSWMEKLDTLVKSNKSIQNAVLSESCIVAFNFVGENQLYPLFVLKAETNARKKSWLQLIELLYPETDFSKDEKNYSKTTMVSMLETNGTKTFFYSILDGLIIASPKEILVEKAIRQTNSPSLMANTNFSALSKTVTSQSKMAWFVNYKTFPDVIARWFKGKTSYTSNEFGEKVGVNVRNAVRNFSGFAAWSELDTEIENDHIRLSGMSVANDSLHHFLSLFEGQQAVRSAADEVLPKTTSFFTSYSFSNKTLFFENLEKYFTHSENYYKREDRIRKIDASLRSDFKNVFQGFVKDEIVVASTTIPEDAQNKTTLFILPTEGKSNAESQFAGLLSNYAQRSEIAPESLKSVYSVDKETVFTIYRFPFPSVPGLWLGVPFGFSEAKFAAFYGNTLVFCNNEPGLHDYLHQMVLGATLSKEPRYMEYKSRCSSRSNFNSYVNVGRMMGIKTELFSGEMVRHIEKNTEATDKIQSLGWQISNEGNMFFNAIILSIDGGAEVEAQTTWQSNVGGKITSKPQITLNHDEPEYREIMVQDERNKLHQVSKEGRVRWSVDIEEPIMSEIHQVDVFGNGRLQYLFNTKTRLFLFDRNGNNVGGFPVKFRSPATNGVSVFDYDNNRKYRYFVACEDKTVVAFDAEGKILSGWEFGKTDHVVTSPVQHFRVQNKDYIVFKDKSRAYIQNRRGETRVETKVQLNDSKTPVFLNLDGKPKIVTTDNSGRVLYFYFDGTSTEKKVGNFSANHFFTVTDLNGNGIPDFVFLDGKELSVFEENGKKLFDKKFKNEIQHPANIYIFGSNSVKIGVVDSKGNKIYLYDQAGKLHEGFPLQGNSEFSIGKTERSAAALNLIVGSKGGDLYNYTLN